MIWEQLVEVQELEKCRGITRGGRTSPASVLESILQRGNFFVFMSTLKELKIIKGSEFFRYAQKARLPLIYVNNPLGAAQLQ